MNTPDTEDVVDLAGLDAAEQRRLREVHQLLLQAGPPPELRGGLAETPRGATVLRFPAAVRRRGAAALILAATVGAAAFGGGYLLNEPAASFKTVRVVAMAGKSSTASIRVGAADSNGNWPLELAVTGLPKLTNKRSYYELMLVRNGKPTYPCGGFVMKGHSTKLQFTVPYKVSANSKWVVMVLTPQPGPSRFAGPIVLT